MKKLTGRVAIVTGAAQGIGKGIAEALAAQGALVALWDLNESVHETCRAIERSGQQAVAQVVDVAEADHTRRLAKGLHDAFGAVDILVNNAGIAHFARFLEMDQKQCNRLFQVNFFGTWNCCQAVMPFMVQQRYGRIINVSSVTGPRVATSGLSAYSATKGALTAFTRSLALEAASKGITVNAILPGFIDTALTKPLADDFGMDETAFSLWLEQSIPMQRFGTITELGSLAAFLASSESGYITGQEIVIDGGNTIQEVKGIR